LLKIDEALEHLPIKDGEKLKMLSYQTAPLRNLGATAGGREGFGKKLDLNCV
jgi:hypothetical protein